MLSSVCVYCGSSPGTDPKFIQLATDLGSAIGLADVELVYGGGTKGLMGAVANGAFAAGGKVTGIIPEFLIEKEASREALTELSELIVTKDMHERKHTMFERAEAFVTLPGGIGTLEEVVEIMTWAQLGRHDKPIIIANWNGYWDPFASLLQHMDIGGFLHSSDSIKPVIVESVQQIMEVLASSPAGAGADSLKEVL
ncbi:MAG: TIGR00730 family Rossman fold protein [Pseudomonadota bacterium]